MVDEEPDATRVADALRHEGFTVRVAADAAEALSLLPTLRPAVVIADHDLPEESGDTLARRARALPGPASRTPIFLLCNPKNARARVSKPAFGADVCKFKPLSFPDIIGEVRRLLEMAPRLAQMRVALPALGPAQPSFSVALAQASVVGALTLLEVEPRSGRLEVRDAALHVVLHVAGGQLFGATIDGRPAATLLGVKQALAIDSGVLTFTAMPLDVASAASADPTPIAAALASATPRRPAAADPPAPQGSQPPVAPSQPPKVRRHRSTQAMPAVSSIPPRPTPAPHAVDLHANPADGVTPADIADALLLLAAEGKVDTSLEIEPSADTCRVLLSQPQGRTELVALAEPMGRAVVARLLVLAALDLASSNDQIGRVRIRYGDASLDVAVMSRATSAGAALEMKRLTRASLATGDASDAEQIAAQGTYRVLRELGSGGMGVVYLARHTFLERDVAIKLLRREYAAQPDIASRFVTEARAAARARHPGLVDVSDFGLLPDGRAFLVMEVVGGKTLDDILAAEGPLPFARIVDIGAQIALALHAAHLQAVVHRDLKPSNVLVAPGDRVKVSDFGVAKLRNASGPHTTVAGLILGTPDYMSPEQINAAPIDHRTDIYALGCVLHELVSGESVFTGTSPMAILTAHLLTPPTPPRSPHGPVPPALLRTIARALAKDRADRYFTMEELANDLQATHGGAQ